MTRKELQSAVRAQLVSVPHPIKDARTIVAFCCDCTKEELVMYGEQAVSKKHVKQALRIAKKRADGTPIAYIVGTWPFYGRDFLINSSTLIPRPETESLVDVAKKRRTPKTCYVDIGTGSGAIAVTLAAETDAPVIATDISRKALSVAKRNARAHQVGDLVTFRRGSLLKALKPRNLTHGNPLVICANLPYLTQEMLTKSSEQSFANELVHEPEDALVSDAHDGLDLYRQLFDQLRDVRHLLPEEVRVLIELLPNQRKAAITLIKKRFQDARIRSHKDLSNRYRIVEAQI